MWYPECEPSFLQFVILNKARLVNYVLHAKHSKIFKSENLQQDLGEDFGEILEKA